MTQSMLPGRPTNAPGTVPLRYRIGDFSTFRNALLERLVSPTLLPDDVPAGTGNPFLHWTERSGDDYARVFLELWAYLGDVLTFYQERIANEAFIETATQRENVMRLARLVEYRPLAGSAATAYLAFTASSGSPALPLGFRVATRAAGGAAPAVFETSAPLDVVARTSMMPLVPTVHVDQFGTIAGVGQVRRPVRLAGTSTGLRPGDQLLVVQNASRAERDDLRTLLEVTVDTAAQVTTVVWQEDAGTRYIDSPDDPVALFALRVSASPFGSTAPNWNTLSPTLTSPGTASPPVPPGPFAGENWDDANATPQSNPWPFLPLPTAALASIALDGVYSVAAGTRLVLIGGDSGGSPATAVYRVTAARDCGVSAYAVEAKVTVLTLDRAVVPSASFRVRGTTILARSEQLQRYDRASPPLAGMRLELAGTFPELVTGRTIVVRGITTSGTPVAELATISTVEAGTATTTVTLRAALTNRYRRETCVVLGNVVAATHGESVAGETLGSGDATPFQAYALGEAPLTYVASTGADNLDTVQSTLLVTVNGVAWSEVPSLYGAASDAQRYTTSQDAANATTVYFGDGFSGARPPTGTDNIRANYRFGLGTQGNVDAGAIAQLIDGATGLASVTNPLAATGGTDPETTASIRRNAPVQAATFGRAVTAADVAALALRYPGVAKARAVLAPGMPSVTLTIAGSDPRPADRDAFPPLAARLRNYIDARRDIRLPIRIRQFTPEYLSLAVVIDVASRYPRAATLRSVAQLLGPGSSDSDEGYFAFARRIFGETLALGTLYAMIAGVPGVARARITRFGPATSDDVAQSLSAGGDQLFVIVNDQAAPEYGTVTVTYGTGGYLDT